MNDTSLLQAFAQRIKRVTRLFGVDIVKYNFYHSDAVLLQKVIREFRIATILDVGANTGQYALERLDKGFKGKIFSFEPIPSVYSKLEQAAKKHPQWATYPLGAGSSETEMMINVSENFVSSSILKVDSASLSAEPTTRITHQEKIKLTTVDSFFKQHPDMDKEILLKLDVQGFEIEALKGAVSSLDKIRIVQAELSFTKLYENGPLYDEVAGFLKSHHFELFSIMPGFRDDATGQMLQADGLFVRKDT